MDGSRINSLLQAAEMDLRGQNSTYAATSSSSSTTNSINTAFTSLSIIPSPKVASSATASSSSSVVRRPTKAKEKRQALAAGLVSSANRIKQAVTHPSQDLPAIANLIKRNKELENRNRYLHASFSAAIANKHSILGKENSELKEQYEKLQRAHQNLLDIFATIKKEKDELSFELARVKMEIAGERQDFNRLQDAIKTLKRENNALNARVQNMRSSQKEDEDVQIIRYSNWPIIPKPSVAPER